MTILQVNNINKISTFGPQQRTVPVLLALQSTVQLVDTASYATIARQTGHKKSIEIRIIFLQVCCLACRIFRFATRRVRDRASTQPRGINASAAHGHLNLRFCSGLYQRGTDAHSLLLCIRKVAQPTVERCERLFARRIPSSIKLLSCIAHSLRRHRVSNPSKLATPSSNVIDGNYQNGRVPDRNLWYLMKSHLATLVLAYAVVCTSVIET